ncbi:MAG TPA: hypothetical protein VMM78_13965 [Thermomicrobiales bacterium]|nr:hypothetical protein [Thermomicrobiales bacterium]
MLLAHTDANVPIGMGMPAACVGVATGGGGRETGQHIVTPPIADGLSQLVALRVTATASIASPAVFR